MVDGAIFLTTCEGDGRKWSVRAIVEQEPLSFAGRDATSGCSNLHVYLRRTGQLALERVVLRRISLLAT